MPGPLFHAGATGNCPHGGIISAISSNTRVLVNGMAAVTVSDFTSISGCPFIIMPANKSQPCVKVQWITPATKVLICGQPAVLQTSSNLCLSAEQIPQGQGMINNNQTRVTGT